jgi:hypothetical protein
MSPVSWPCPAGSSNGAGEYALSLDRGRPWRLLIVPAMLDEGNRMRRFTAEVMRRLDRAGIDSFLPDLPGTNESLQLLERQTPADWRAAMLAAKRHFDASHVLALRGGALVAPQGLHSWHLAPVKGASLLRQMLRARILARREMGREESQQGLMDLGLAEGLELAGYRLGAGFLRELQGLEPATSQHITTIGQDMLGGSALWLRAEPDEDAMQADSLAAIISVGIRE